ncbi:helix-turn-helix domain-containing protein [Phocaeicola sp.]
MMYVDNEVLEKMIMTIVEGFDRIEKKLDRMNRLKDCMDGDTLMDNCDLAQLLGVTQRTIARYREKGLIRYYQTDENGKNYYRSSEIQEFLRQKGKVKK